MLFLLGILLESRDFSMCAYFQCPYIHIYAYIFFFLNNNNQSEFINFFYPQTLLSLATVNTHKIQLTVTVALEMKLAPLTNTQIVLKVFNYIFYTQAQGLSLHQIF